MRTDRPSVKNIVLRVVTLRCPACGESSIIAGPFQIAQQCHSCRVVFKREQGFFVGAILINVITTEAVILLAYLISIPVMTFDSQNALWFLFAIAILFPIAFYHHSWSIWLGFDHFVEGLPKS